MMDNLLLLTELTHPDLSLTTAKSGWDGKCVHCGWPHHPTDGPRCKNCKGEWGGTTAAAPSREARTDGR